MKMISVGLAVAGLFATSTSLADPALDNFYRQQRLDAERAQAAALQDMAHNQRRGFQVQPMADLNFAPVGAAIRQKRQIEADRENQRQWMEIERQRLALERARAEANQAASLRQAAPAPECQKDEWWSRTDGAPNVLSNVHTLRRVGNLAMETIKTVDQEGPVYMILVADCSTMTWVTEEGERKSPRAGTPAVARIARMCAAPLTNKQ